MRYLCQYLCLRNVVMRYLCQCLVAAMVLGLQVLAKNVVQDVVDWEASWRVTGSSSMPLSRFQQVILTYVTDFQPLTASSDPWDEPRAVPCIGM